MTEEEKLSQKHKINICPELLITFNIKDLINYYKKIWNLSDIFVSHISQEEIKTKNKINLSIKSKKVIKHSKSVTKLIESSSKKVSNKYI